MCALAPPLLERVLAGLGLSLRPEATGEGLRMLFGAWCRTVPFDNVRKLIHLRRQDAGPLPGDTPAEFFEAWLRLGTGGTCWAGNGALQGLLQSLGFDARRALATMLVSPNLPPNHGTVVVTLERTRYLVDASMLHDEPLPLNDSAHTSIGHPAWGVQCVARAGQSFIRWRPLHTLDGLDCRLEALDVSALCFHERHENSRPWSPFNYALYARVNRGNSVLGTAFGQRVEFDAGGSVRQRPLAPGERAQFLIDELGMDEALVQLLPPDLPTPPPPQSAAARRQQRHPPGTP
jgi:N-hydroxyarylamine O-acetyltransferase